ncbi:MAG: toprim domain-containing protein [bacterium]
MNDDFNLQDYLSERGILYWTKGKEIITKCFFSDCDSNSREDEGHLYFSIDTGQYQCKKCGAKGNIITLQKFFNENPFSTFGRNGFSSNGRDIFDGGFVSQKDDKKLTAKIVEECHKALPKIIVEYLNTRGITNEIIIKYKLGYKYQYGKWWITIPIKDIKGNYLFFKLRQDPQSGNEKMTWPAGGGEAQIFDWESLLTASDRVLIAEGEMDTLLMKSKGIQCVSGTHGAGTTKDEWIEYFKPELEYYICYDNDKAGKDGALNLAQKLFKNGRKNLHIINLPEEVGEKGDLGDYVVRLGLPIDDIFAKYAKSYPEKIDTSIFKEIEGEDVCKILESTIKKDNENKLVTFLSMLTTYTEDAQMNLFFNAPSSTGKSHIPLSVVELFPKEDVITLAYCSPTAFFHDQGLLNREKNEIVVNLSRKIIIFTDMPDQSLISRLRPILSHDQKESRLKTTDKDQKGGNRTKNVVLVGFPSVYFCSAEMRVDEQESTRFLMLSPSIEHDKVYQGIRQSISKASDGEKFNQTIDADPERNLLKKRIIAIKQENIFDVKIEDVEHVEKLYLKEGASVRPRQQRDIKKVISIIKGFAILNLWFRKRNGDYIWASSKDIEDGFIIWDKLSYGQDYGLAPYLFDIYSKVIMVLWNEPDDSDFSSLTGGGEKKKFITRKEILKKYYQIYKMPLGMQKLRQQILPQLEQVGLIAQERGGEDMREMVVIPLETGAEEEGI